MEKKTKIQFNVMASILIILFAISLTPVTLQNDTFYTIKIGEYILENGITMEDPFSWHENLPYTYPHWAYDVGTFLVYKVGGYLGIYILTAILSAVLGLSIYFTGAKLTKNHLTSFLITLWSMYLLRAFIAARAQLVTFILFLLTIFFIEKFIKTGKKRYAIALIVIPIIIANVHLAVWPFYFVLYLPYIGEYIISLLSTSNLWLRKLRINRLKKKLLKENFVEKLSKIKQKIAKLEEKNENSNIKKEKIRINAYKLEIVRDNNVKWLILIMIICLFTGLLTPLHGAPYTYLINTIKGNTTQFISEHLPLTLANNIDFMILITVFLAILIFTDTKIRLRDLFMIGGLLFLAIKTQRQVSIFVLIGSVILNRLLCYFFNKYDKGGTERFIKIMTTLPGKILTISIVLLCCISFAREKIGNKFVDETTYPTKAAEYIKENINLSTMKLYNEYNYGSYLLMQGIPVFIDSRADLYSPEFNKGKDIFSDFIDISNLGVYYENKFEEYEITHVIIYKNAKLNMFLSRNDKYKELYSDDYFCVYERLN